MVFIGGALGDDTPRDEARALRFAYGVISQVLGDVNIWEHPRYSDPPAAANAELRGFTAIREWAIEYYPDGRGGSGAGLRAVAETTSRRYRTTFLGQT